MRIARIKLRDDFLLQALVERVGFGGVPLGIISMFLSVAQRPPDIRAVGLGPPAIHFGEVETSVHEHLHAARPTGFPGATRRVQPCIDALHQVFGQKHLVIGEENHRRTSLAVSDKLRPFPNQDLPGKICRMRFTCDDELHRPFGIGEEAEQSRRIVQQQIGSLVGGEASRETKGKDAGI